MADIVKLIYKGDEMAQGGGSASVPQADTSTIGTVRVATYNELKNGTATGSEGEYLVPDAGNLAKRELKTRDIIDQGGRATLTGWGDSQQLSFTMTETGFFQVRWYDLIIKGKKINSVTVTGGSNSQVLVHEKFQEIPTLSSTEKENYSAMVERNILCFGKKGETGTITISSIADPTSSVITWNDVPDNAKKATLITTGATIGF